MTVWLVSQKLHLAHTRAPFWGRLEGILGPSFGHLGAILGHLGAISGSSWVCCDQFQGYDFRGRALQHHFLVSSSRLGAILGLP